MALKPKKFRVAVAGNTVDTRTITPDMLRECVETFSLEGYTPRVNIEHIRGLTGEKPFPTCGDVIGLSVQEDVLNIAGKTEKRTCLYAEIRPNEHAAALNKADQKVFTSIELLPDFAGSGKFGLGGLALTDSPASVGTERLQFAKVTKAWLIPGDDQVKFDEDATTTAATDAFSAMAGFFKTLTQPAQPTPAVQPAPDSVTEPVPGNFAAVVAQLSQGMALMSAAIESGNKATTEAIADLRKEHDALKASLEAQPDPNFTARQPAAGTDASKDLADC